MYPSIFDASTLEENKNRIDKLTVTSQPKWGKMNVAQMLAHLNVAYDYSQGKKKAKINPILKFILKTFIKKSVVGNKPYTKNGKTPSYFLITEEKEFDKEKAALLVNMKWVFEKGEAYFQDRPTASFGKLKAQEWSNLYQKHLDHHLTQFGV